LLKKCSLEKKLKKHRYPPLKKTIKNQNLGTPNFLTPGCQYHQVLRKKDWEVSIAPSPMQNLKKNAVRAPIKFGSRALCALGNEKLFAIC